MYTKHLVLSLLLFTLVAAQTPAYAQDTTTKRRPDNAEFVTETQVRLTTESVTVAEVSSATTPAAPKQSFWDMIRQSWQDFIGTLRNLFN